MSKFATLTIEELEDSLQELLPGGFEVKSTRKGIIIVTNLKENAYGELVDIDDDLDGDGDDSLFDDENMESISEDEDEDD